MGASQFSNLSSSVSFRLSSQDEDGYITCIGLEYRPTSNVKESVDKNAWRKKIIVDEEVPMWTKTRCPIFTVQIQQHYGDRGEILFQPLLALALCKYDQSWRPPRIQNTVQGIPNPPPILGKPSHLLMCSSTLIGTCERNINLHSGLLSPSVPFCAQHQLIPEVHISACAEQKLATKTE